MTNPYIIYGTVIKNNIEQDSIVVTIENISKVKTLDFSGNGHHATSYVPATSNGKLGYAIEFSNDNHYIDCTNITDASSEFSISLWFLIDDLSAKRNLFFRANGNSLYPRCYINTDGTIGFQYSVDSLTKSIVSINTISTDTWYNLICTIDANSGGKLYINNVEWGSSSHTNTTIDSDIYTMLLGRDSNLSNYMRGMIDEVMLYNKVLSSDERSERYNSGNSAIFNPLDETGLTGYWRFDYPSISTTIDSEGHYIIDDIAQIPTGYTIGDSIRISLEDGTVETFIAASAPEEKQIDFIYNIYTIDTILRKAYSSEYSIDALLKQYIDENYKLDTLLKHLSTDEIYKIDILLKNINNDSDYKLDTLLKGINSKNYKLDTLLKHLSTDEIYKIDALLNSAKDKNYVIDIILTLSSINNVLYNIDILLKKLNINSDYDIDTILRKAYDSEYLIDTLLHHRYTYEYIIDALISLSRHNNYNLDTLFKKYNTDKTYVLDLLLINIINENYTIDTLIKSMNDKTLSIDVLFITMSQTYSIYNIDCIISKSTTYKPTVYATLEKPIGSGKKLTQRITSRET